MRVLIAHSFYRLPGGEDTYVTRQVELLRRRHEVSLLRRDNADLPEGAPTALRMVYSRSERRRVDEAVASFEPDVVHIHNAYPALGPAVHLVADRRRIPLVMTVHNMRLRCPNGLMFTEGQLCRRCQGGNYVHGMLHECFASRKQALAYTTALWLHRYPASLERKISLFIAPSNFIRNRIVEWGLSSSRTRFVPLPVELPAYNPPKQNGYGLYLGRLSEEKGVAVLMQALKRAGDPSFCIVGDGPLHARLCDLKRELGLSNTQLPGRVPLEEVPRVIAGASFTVLPSVWEENAPLSALDSMAAGRPLIVSDTGGLPELAALDRGLIIPPGDVEALATGIRGLVEDPAHRTEMGRAARTYAEKELTYERHLERLEEAYASVT